jgi:DNA (cytosine-5)-methyltransferase 1
VIDNGRVRYLTPGECEKLQGFPPGYTAGFSDTQRYKFLGNSIATPVLRFLGERILAVDRGMLALSKAG